MLNVLQDESLRMVVTDITIYANYYCTDIIFKIYEGDKSGNGKISKKDCYQRNEKTESYVSFITNTIKVISTCDYDVKRKGQYIICKRL